MRLSITAKVFTAFTVVLVVFALTSAHSVWQLQRLQGNVRLIQKGHLRAMLALTGLNADLKGFDRVLDEKDPVFLEKMLTVARSLYPFPADMRRHVSEARRAVSDSLVAETPKDEWALMEELARDLEGLNHSLNQLADGAGDLTLAVMQREFGRIRDVQASLRERSRLLQTQVGRMTGTLKEAVGQAVLRADQEEQRAIWATIVLTAVAIVVSLGVTWTAGATIRPVRRLTEAVKRVSAGGEMGLVEVETSDEVGVLAAEFNRMVQSLAARDRVIVRNERLATVGRMAAQVAHEVRNPLMSIGLNTELLEEEVAAAGMDDEAATESRAILQAIQSEVERLTQVTENYLTLARLPDPELGSGRVEEVLEDLLDFQGEELSRAGIAVHFEPDAALPEVRADTNQLRQAFLNLVRNATDAMAGGGQLTVGAREAEGGVEISITDTGPGVPDEERDRIFDPLYSTKKDGTGLGLAVARQIVETHGGAVRCEAAEGGGTVFVVQLPGSVPASGRGPVPA